MLVKIAINSNVTGKDEPDPKFASKITYDFVVKELDCDELAEEIKQRHNICSVCLDKKGKFHRNKKNFKSGQVFGIDIDNADPDKYFPIDEAFNDPFIKQNAYIIYTTPSHTEELNKFRLLFCLPTEITSEEKYSHIVTAFIARFGGDASCKDGSRFFYGTGKNGTVIKLGNVLSEETVAQILADYIATKANPAHLKTDFQSLVDGVGCDVVEPAHDIDLEKWKFVTRVFRADFNDLITTKLNSKMNIITDAKEGERNSLLNKHAYIMGSVISAANILGFDLEPQHYLDKLIETGTNLGLPKDEATNTATNSFTKGLEEPDKIGMPFFYCYISWLDYKNFKPLDHWFCHNILRSAAYSGQLGIGRLFAVFEYGHRLFDHIAQSWLVYDDGVWATDKTQSTHKKLTDITRAYLCDVARSGLVQLEKLRLEQKKANEDPEKSKVDFDDKDEEIKNLEAEIRIFKEAAEKLGRNKFGIDCLEHSTRELAAVTTDFDNNPLLLNLANGTYDFGSFQFIPHDPKHLITYKIGVQYNPDADCPKWTTFLKDIFKYDEDLISFVQRWVGYMLTGLTDQQYLFFAFGTGANGKTTFFKVVEKLLGEYFAHVPIAILLDNAFGNNNVDYQLARVRGKRVVLPSEIPGGRFLNESQVKDITGGDKLPARQIYAKPFDYFPEFKICLLGNHKPEIKGSDEGIWRRILLIPFAYTIPEEARRPMDDVLAEFNEEISGILNWCIEGFKQYKKYGGLEPPDCVKKAVSEYKEDCDILGPFLTECTINKDKSKTLLVEIWKELGSYYEKINDSVPIKNSRKLSSLLRDRGYKVEKGTGNKTYVHGLGLLPDKDEPDFIDGLNESQQEDIPF